MSNPKSHSCRSKPGSRESGQKNGSVAGNYNDWDPDRAVVVSNAASGANARLGIDDVRDAAADAGIHHHGIEDIDALKDVLRACADSGCSLIVVNAGDGTVCRVIEIIRETGWFAAEPSLALLRGGTTNMIHNDVGFPGKPGAGLRRLVSCLRSGRCTPQERHALRVRQTGPGVTRYGFFLGTHAVPKAILRTRSRLHRHVSTGRVSEVISIAAMVWRLWRRRVHDDPVVAPVPLELSRDGEAWRQVEHILLLAISVRRLVLGIRPLSRGQRAGLAVLNWPDYRLMPWLRRFLRGSLDELDGVSLRGDFGWVLDGEIHSHGETDGELEIKVDAPVRFLTGSG